eukprot:5796265-Prymnesium_polylepis.1
MLKPGEVAVSVALNGCQRDLTGWNPRPWTVGRRRGDVPDFGLLTMFSISKILDLKYSRSGKLPANSLSSFPR